MHTFILTLLLPFLVSEVAAGCCKSDTVKQIDVKAIQPIASAPPADPIDIHHLDLRFVGCTDDRKEIIKRVIETTSHIFAYAKSTLDDSQSQAYKTWFGAFDRLNHDTVMRIFSEIGGKPHTFTYDCETCLSRYPEESSMDAYAQLTRNAPRHIYLCPRFWERGLLGFDSQTVLVVRSMVQYAGRGWVTADLLGREAAKRLAKENPIKATKSANNYRYFAETYFGTKDGQELFFKKLDKLTIHKETNTPTGKEFEHTVERIG